MRFKSTKGQKDVPFVKVALNGIANDGGLYIPEEFPKISIPELQLWHEEKISYREVAFRLCQLYLLDSPDSSADLGFSMTKDDLKNIVWKSFDSFNIEETVRLDTMKNENISNSKIELYLCELFHGPTLAFKDLALQFMGNLFQFILNQQGMHRNLLVATSGDTGPAALASFKGKTGVDIHCLYPDGMVSEFQEAQMLNVGGDNTHVYCVKGSNSDTLDEVVKAIFNDNEFKEEFQVGSVNSFNFARLMIQSAHFIYSYLRVIKHSSDIGKQRVTFSIPNGAFGNAISCLFAKKMGLPVGHVFISSSINDSTFQLFSTGKFSPEKTFCSLAPAIDIQVPYNLERFFFLTIAKENPKTLTELMKRFDEKNLQLSKEDLKTINEYFTSERVSDKEIKETLQEFYESNSNKIICPQTAVAVKGCEKILNSKYTAEESLTVICLGTAHPAKFEQVIQDTLHIDPKEILSEEQRKQHEKVAPRPETDFLNIENVLKQKMINCTKKHKQQ